MDTKAILKKREKKLKRKREEELAKQAAA
jgi:hypothetical protein